MTTNSQDFKLRDCIGYQNGIGNYIYPDKMLQWLTKRVMLITEQTATPGLEINPTERLRGRRVELLKLIDELKKELNNATT